MPTKQWTPRITTSNLVTVRPTVSTTPAYTSGDQLGGVMTIADVIRPDSAMSGDGTCCLHSITIIDESKQSAAVDVFFFNASPTLVSVDNGAFDISDSEMQSKCVGVVSIGTSYSSSSSSSVSSDGNLGLLLEATSTTSLYAVAVVRGTPTYATTSAMTFKFGFLID